MKASDEKIIVTNLRESFLPSGQDTIIIFRIRFENGTKIGLISSMSSEMLRKPPTEEPETMKDTEDLIAFTLVNCDSLVVSLTAKTDLGESSIGWRERKIGLIQKVIPDPGGSEKAKLFFVLQKADIDEFLKELLSLPYYASFPSRGIKMNEIKNLTFVRFLKEIVLRE